MREGVVAGEQCHEGQVRLAFEYIPGHLHVSKIAISMHGLKYALATTISQVIPIAVQVSITRSELHTMQTETRTPIYNLDY